MQMNLWKTASLNKGPYSKNHQEKLPTKAKNQQKSKNQKQKDHPLLWAHARISSGGRRWHRVNGQQGARQVKEPKILEQEPLGQGQEQEQTRPEQKQDPPSQEREKKPPGQEQKRDGLTFPMVS